MNDFKSLQCRVYLKWDNENHEIYTINEPAHAYQLVKEELGSSDRERFVSILLTTRNTVIGVETVSVGTLSNCLISPRELLKSALISNAHGLILAHNHPSGDLTPSEEDIRSTRMIVQAGDLMGIKILDHLIIGRDGFKSLKEMGVLKKGKSLLSNLYHKDMF
jgi:DNA repair protein RadC